MWHLPDGHSPQAVTTPNAEGGVIYLFDDVTERPDLERRYDALIRVQGETLDNLAEAGRGVRQRRPLAAVQSGLLRSCGSCRRRTLAERPHIETVIGCASQALRRPARLWRRLHAAITAIDDRVPRIGRTMPARRQRGRLRHGAAARRRHGRHPPGRHRHRQRGTEKQRKERGARGRPTRSRSTSCTTYPMKCARRSPTIIGFAHFLGDLATGPLNEKQREYLGYITTSTPNALVRHHQQYPRPRQHRRRRRDDARSRALVDIRKTACIDAAEGVQDRLMQERHRARHPGSCPISAASWPTSGACGRRCSTSWPTR